MFEQLKVYHAKHKEGIIIKYENGLYLIDFNSGVKQVASGSWLTSLFLNKTDAYNKKENIDLSLYENILEHDNSLKNSKKKKRVWKTRRDRTVENFWIEENESYFNDENILNNTVVNMNDIKDINKDAISREEEALEKIYSMYEDHYEQEGYFSEYYPGHQDYEVDDIVYEAYIEDPWDKSNINELIYQTEDEELEAELMQHILLMNEEKFILKKEMIDREEERCIVIVCSELIKLKNRNAVKLIGIDVRTAKLVTIVDTNGKEKGLISYNAKVYHLIGKTVVIKAKFECLEFSNRQNVLRIVSEFSVISNFDISTLNDLDWKYNILTDGKYGLISDFNMVEVLSKEYRDKPFRLLVNFTDTQIKKKRNRTDFCIKMGNAYPTIKDKTFLNKKIQDKHYRGIALITWRISSLGGINYFVEKMYGNILNDEELHKLKSKRLGSSEDNAIDNESDYEYVTSSIDSMVASPFYFNEYLDRNVSYMEEEIENGEDTASALNQEYMYWFSDDEYVEGSEYYEYF